VLIFLFTFKFYRIKAEIVLFMNPKYKVDVLLNVGDFFKYFVQKIIVMSVSDVGS